MVNGDFFTYERMKKFKMCDSDKCPRCGMTETMKHLLWECDESRNIWRLFNGMLSEVTNSNCMIRDYNDLYNMPGNAVVNTLKVKIIQELIQIVRPMRWSVENLKTIVADLKNIELYIAIKNNKLHSYNNKWKCLETFLHS
jgi:hypothetical protein